MNKAEFLARAGWANAKSTPLAGDASGRHYARLTKTTRTAILMDEGDGSQQSLATFARIARYLSSLGLSTPEILSEGDDRFLLLEDLGDTVFARVMATSPEQEMTLYKAAIDAMIAWQSAPVPDFISPYGPSEMADAIQPVFDWYKMSGIDYAQSYINDLKALFLKALNTHLSGTSVFIHRDFHAENLVWLPARTGPARAGLLDFQDAVSGDPAYDLASLLVDIRRDVRPEIQAQLTDYYVGKSGVDPGPFNTAFALCSAQRNLRILGIFAALSIRDGKPAYCDLIPTVWRNLQRDVAHPELSEIRIALQDLPEPSAALLNSIRHANV